MVLDSMEVWWHCRCVLKYNLSAISVALRLNHTVTCITDKHVSLVVT